MEKAYIGIMLSERTQTLKVVYFMTPFIWHPPPKKQNYRDRE